MRDPMPFHFILVRTEPDFIEYEVEEGDLRCILTVQAESADDVWAVASAYDPDGQEIDTFYERVSSIANAMSEADAIIHSALRAYDAYIHATANRRRYRAE